MTIRHQCGKQDSIYGNQTATYLVNSSVYMTTRNQHGKLCKQFNLMCLYCSAGSVRELSWFQNIYLFILSTGKVHFKIRSDYSVTCGSVVLFLKTFHTIYWRHADKANTKPCIAFCRLDMTYFPFDKQTCFADVAMQEFAIYQINMTQGTKGQFSITINMLGQTEGNGRGRGSIG